MADMLKLTIRQSVRELLLPLALYVVLFSVGSAEAVYDLTTVTVDAGPVYAVGAVVAVGLLALWGVRKFIKTVNRS